MWFPGDTAKLIVDSPVPEGHTAAMLIYATHTKKEVVETPNGLHQPLLPGKLPGLCVLHLGGRAADSANSDVNIVPQQPHAVPAK